MDIVTDCHVVELGKKAGNIAHIFNKVKKRKNTQQKVDAMQEIHKRQTLKNAKKKFRHISEQF